MPNTPKRVAIQGVAGAFHELAAKQFFGPDIHPVECETFKDVCSKLSHGEVDYSMMAIENTIAGTLLPNYSLLTEYKLKIIGEVYLHIEMQLLALPGVRLEDLEFIHSHPIAIEQCREYLNTLPAHIKIVSTNDTAESAKLIAEKQLTNTAAIAGYAAGQLYHLDILEKNIHTNKQNFTRFLVLSTHSIENEDNNKASVCFEVMHRSGSLAEVLGIWAKHKVNLTKIQSVPIIGKPYQYWFYVDLEYPDQKEYNEAMRLVLKNVASFSLLGEYKHGTLEF